MAVRGIVEAIAAEVAAAGLYNATKSAMPGNVTPLQETFQEHSEGVTWGVGNQSGVPRQHGEFHVQG